ncbi:uncharacterized protein FA14DRAFT_177508 [Meira miltonrushii]|uniref:DNA replication regulator Sld3 C-terminal domain-containing protein n=1 Tax=Meira miltonrushii TaxID=1280837 RepID=A0A316VRW1_9BASI|nr:uncharacterized protein FA14DRAFT_177508 [Meira miltonrushii]PWN38235.1 hypothetical protein FA14DRAFT_177508 [Meira miltonrushii]
MLQTRLDLGCPFTWPASVASITLTNDQEQHNASPLIPENWIQLRYNESLWLGEHHTPLSAFLSHVSHLQHTCSTQNTAEALRLLIRSRAEVRQRFSGTADGTSGWSDKDKLLACIDAKGTIDQPDSERAIVCNALKSGPAKVVAKELQESKESGIGSFGKLWIDAIETRELQLQVMVLLSLLQLNAENPDLSKMNKSIEKDGESSSSPSSVKRRKRKAEKSQRWTGVGSIFPWQMGKPPTSTGSKETNPSSESLSDPEVLSKQFEGIVDFLCLRVATTNISSSIPFGSEGRKKESKDDRDVLQWFCYLIETHFAKALPRQCGTLRSRCFISIAATPAKRSRQKDSRTKSDDPRAKSVDARPKESVGALQRSLLRENSQRTQSFAAAKRKSTWDAREVSVRKRWERSQSVGSSINGVDRQDGMAYQQSIKQPVQQPAQVIALSTPSKPRQVQHLPTRRKTMNTNGFSQMTDGKQKISGTNWHRSESQPVLTSSADSIFGPSMNTNDNDEEEDTGMENLDESLRQAFDDDDDDLNTDPIFGTGYSDW